MYEIPNATKYPATVNARQMTEIFSDPRTGDLVLLFMMKLMTNGRVDRGRAKDQPFQKDAFEASASNPLFCQIRSKTKAVLPPESSGRTGSDDQYTPCGHGGESEDRNASASLSRSSMNSKTESNDFVRVIVQSSLSNVKTGESTGSSHLMAQNDGRSSQYIMSRSSGMK